MPLPGGSDPNPVPVPLVLQARDHSFCHYSCKVLPNSQKVIKLIAPLSRCFRAISSHLQTCGCSIVVGSNPEKINKVEDLKGVVFEIIVHFQPINCVGNSTVFGIGSWPLLLREGTSQLLRQVSKEEKLDLGAHLKGFFTFVI